MLANPYYKKITVVNYYQEILQSFLLSSCEFVTILLTLVYLKWTANTQNVSFYKEKFVLLKNKFQGIMPSGILECL